MHTPVLLNEVLGFLAPKKNSIVIDGTLGGGGHTEAILKKIGTKGMVVGVDWDPETINRAKIKFKDRKNIVLLEGNYAQLVDILKEKKINKADGLLLDLGLSSYQLEYSGRGFSFRRSEPLLMTYDPEKQPIREILRNLKADELAKIIFEFSGEKFAKRIAEAICREEKKKEIRTTGELREIVKNAVPKHYERGRIDPATRTFQALRIYANRELDNLRSVLGQLKNILRPGGKVVIISFHSLEDRIVKRAFGEMNKEGILTTLTKKPIVPSEEEIRKNPRSRSAKLRAAEMNL